VTRFHTEEIASRRSDTTQRLRRKLSGDIDYIVLKALEKDPARRYGSVDQLAEDIRRHTSGRPVLARGGSTMYLASRFIRRNRAAVITGSLVGLSLIAGLIGTSWQAANARRERDRAQRRFEDVKSLAHAVVFNIHDAIMNLPGSTPARKILIDNALTYLNNLSREAKDDPALQNELGVAYGKIADAEGRPDWPNLGQSEDAFKNYQKSLALLESAAKAKPDSLEYARNLVLTQQRLADLHESQGRHKEALQLSEVGLASLEGLREKFPENPWLPGDIILAHDRMGDWKLAAGDTAGATAERELCMKLVEEMYRKHPNDVGFLRGIVIQCAKTGELMAARNDRAGAHASYQRSLTAAKESVARQKDNTEALRDLSIVYGMYSAFTAKIGEIDSALALFSESMKITESLAAQDPGNILGQADVASGHLQLGTMLLDGSRYDAALARFSDAYARYTPLIAADTSNVQHRLGLAQSSRGAGDASAALARSGSLSERARYRSEAIRWYQKSRATYDTLKQKGLLNGEDAAWPDKLTQRMSELGSAKS